MTKTALGLIAIAALMGTPALAADMVVKAPPSPAQTWTGFYAGLNGGYGWGTNSTAVNAIDPTYAFGQTTGTFPTSLSPTIEGGLVGGQLGYNWQTERYLVGLEADLDYSGMNGTANFTSAPAGGFAGYTTTQSNRLEWLSTVRARLGWLITPSTLLYGTGGAAFGRDNIATSDVKLTGLTTCPAGNLFCGVGSSSSTRAGWTAGAGLETMIWSKWTAKVEYLYFDLGTTSDQFISTGVNPGTPLAQVSTRINGNIIRAGLNYKFN